MDPSQDSVRVRTDWIATALLGAAALAVLLPLRRYGVAFGDDGWYLVPVLRMREGAILYRDVWTFYAPLEHHLLEALFHWTGPSIVTARTLLAAGIATTVALTYRLARRAAPPRLAWLPGAVYALVPGPWPKCSLALCTAAYFLMLARALERPGARRFALLGCAAGVTLATRQDLGVAQLGITLVAAPLPALFAAGFGRPGGRARGLALRWSAAALAGFVAAVAPFVVYYGAHGALPDLFEAMFVRGAAQLGAFPPALPALVGLRASEGLGVALLMLLPVVLYAGFGVALLVRLRREGIRRLSVLQGALLAYAVATYTQAVHPVLLVRLLQSALPFYVLATWAAAAALRAAPTRQGRARVVAAATAAAGGLVVFVIAGVRHVHPSDLYTGSVRMLHYHTPMDVLGDRLLVGWAQAEEVRLVRAFYAEHTRPGEPTVALPMHPLYWILVDRPNPTRYLADHAHGNFVMTVAQKRAEAERLHESDARYVIADRGWLAATHPVDPLRLELWKAYHPVRAYGSMVVLERGTSPDGRLLVAILGRVVRGEATSNDLAAVRELAQREPDAPLVWGLLGGLAEAAGETDEAIRAYHRAAATDPQDVHPLELSASLLEETGHLDAAREDVERARAVRESPRLRKLEAVLARRAGGAPREGDRAADVDTLGAGRAGDR